MEIRDKLQRAIGSEKPSNALETLARELKSLGWKQQDLYELFSEFLRTITDDRMADAVRDTMDVIVGWCSPSRALFDTQLKT